VPVLPSIEIPNGGGEINFIEIKVRRSPRRIVRLLRLNFIDVNLICNFCSL
jgi:hypothetical protein